jgi:hypothetical protein
VAVELTKTLAEALVVVAVVVVEELVVQLQVFLELQTLVAEVVELVVINLSVALAALEYLQLSIFVQR